MQTQFSHENRLVTALLVFITMIIGEWGTSHKQSCRVIYGDKAMLSNGSMSGSQAIFSSMISYIYRFGDNNTQVTGML